MDLLQGTVQSWIKKASGWGRLLWHEYETPSQTSVLHTWFPAGGTVVEGSGNGRRDAKLEEVGDWGPIIPELLGPCLLS